LSYGLIANVIGIGTGLVDNTEHAAQLKLKVRKSFYDALKWTLGADYFVTKFDEKGNFGFDFKVGYSSNLAVMYSEIEVLFSPKWAAKLGFRASNSDLLQQTTLAPRMSFGYKVSKNSQFSLAYGSFSQLPQQAYLKFTKELESEKAEHYILNYQYQVEGRRLSLEGYIKDYSSLVKFSNNGNGNMAQYNSSFSNLGSGYAKGLELYWRDNKSVDKLEYWVSYSFIDSKRDFKNYSSSVTPPFVATHSLSVVGKYWINDLKSMVGVTNSFSSGRPYDDKNATEFMNGRTKSYHNLSMNWSYLLTSQKILFFSVENVLGANNVFGYEYANKSVNGVFDRRAITPAATRSFFVGFFWTISGDKKTNQLKDL
jgi:outer membrane cobalamin receptor